jgi:hypothetical protein
MHLKFRKQFTFCTVLIAGIVTALPARQEGQGNSSKLRTSIWLESGQIVNGRYFKLSADQPIQHQWIGHVFADLTQEASIQDRLTISAGIEAQLGYDTSPLKTVDDVLNEPPIQQITFDIIQAEGVYSIGNTDNPFCKLGIGLFPYKYNPDARNLGEYLFRTGAYPGYIITTFDLPLARIAGLRLSSDYVPKLHQDLLITTMRKLRPFYDFTFSYLADYTMGSIFTIGAGASFCNLASVDKSQTTPDDWYKNKYKTSLADSAHYTFQGTKLMARFSLDIKNLLPFRNIFGKEDLRLYGEGAVLGVKNYPASNLFDSTNLINPYGYDDIAQKTPVMMGITIPAFKLLDVIAVEAEWYGCRYPDGYLQVLRNGLPIPDAPNTPGFTNADYRKDDWKWSVYAKREVVGGLCCIVQCARDHTRLNTKLAKNIDYEETMVTSSQWWWMAKVLYSF